MRFGDARPGLDRREFLALAPAALLLACGKRQGGTGPAPSPNSDGRLGARPSASQTSLAPGSYPIGVSATGRDGSLFVPRAAAHGHPLSLLLLLHGAGGSSADLQTAYGLAESSGTVVLAPDSRGNSWDIVYEAYGRDVAFIDQALQRTFNACNIDAGRIASAGFSDGATYSLALGLLNGDLFSRVIAFSPGYVRDDPRHGRPTVFISHGTRDMTLPIATSSEVIVPRLSAEGYEVTYVRFDGEHEVPDEIFRQAFEWLGWAGDCRDP